MPLHNNFQKNFSKSEQNFSEIFFCFINYLLKVSTLSRTPINSCCSVRYSDGYCTVMCVHRGVNEGGLKKSLFGESFQASMGSMWGFGIFVGIFHPSWKIQKNYPFPWKIPANQPRANNLTTLHYSNEI